MMHCRFRPEDIRAAARLRVIPVTVGPAPAGPAPVGAAPAGAAPTRPVADLRPRRRPTRPSVLDRIETRLWARPDARLRAEGWQIVRLGRWRRAYRNPQNVAAGSAAARTRHAADVAADQRASAELAATARSERPAGTAHRVRTPVGAGRWGG